MIYTKSRLVGGVLLVSGTTIGAGMLALPVATGVAGFFPALTLFLIYWVFMTFTALLMLEVNLWMPADTNLITMARETLGKWGAAVSWITYLFLLYALTTAYIAGSGPIFIDFIDSITGLDLPSWTGPLLLLGVFGFFVYKGAQSVDYINRGLMLGLALTYVAMVFFLTPYVELPLLERADWSGIWIAVSIVSTSFGFHIIIPTLTQYLERDPSKLRRVILIGSAIPLVVYIIWESITLGIVPLDGLIEGYRQGLDGASLLGDRLSDSNISLLARFFSLFAIVTSFLGVSLSLTDFLADGLKIPKTEKGKLILCVITFAPPLLFTLYDPRAFLSALEYAGAFGVAILLGVLPVLMVWRGRYHQKRTSTFKAPGGKLTLITALFVALLVIGIELCNKMGLLT